MRRVYLAGMRRTLVTLTFPGLIGLIGLIGPLPVRGEDLRIATQILFAQPTVALETGTSLGQVEFAPHTVPRPGFEVSYGRFGAAFSAPPSGKDWTAAGFPAAEGLNDFRTRYHGSAWGVEAHHRHAGGFYAEAQSPAGAMVHHPAMTLRNSGATLYRSFDPDSRVYRLSEGLPETGGTLDFFLTLGVSHSRLRDDKALLRALGGGESMFRDLRRVDVASLALGGGYALTSNLHGLYFDQALFAGYGPQYRRWGDRSDLAWGLARVNLRMRLGLRNRWFDAGAGFENEAHAALAGAERAVFHSLMAKAGVEVFL